MILSRVQYDMVSVSCRWRCELSQCVSRSVSELVDVGDTRRVGGCAA